MKYKKYLVTALTALTFASANAGGIPTVDVAAIAQFVAGQSADAAAWAQQVQQMMEQIQQAKQIYDSTVGSRGMGNANNDKSISAQVFLPEVWQAMNGKSLPTYQAERAKLPKFKNYPKADVLYDTVASQKAVMNKFYESSQARIKQTQDLLQKIDSAQDPAAKGDLMNRLISEQNAIQAETLVMQSLKEKNQQEMEDAKREATKAVMCYEFGKTNC